MKLRAGRQTESKIPPNLSFHQVVTEFRQFWVIRRWIPPSGIAGRTGRTFGGIIKVDGATFLCAANISTIEMERVLSRDGLNIRPVCIRYPDIKFSIWCQAVYISGMAVYQYLKWNVNCAKINRISGFLKQFFGQIVLPMKNIRFVCMLDILPVIKFSIRLQRLKIRVPS